MATSPTYLVLCRKCHVKLELMLSELMLDPVCRTCGERLSEIYDLQGRVLNRTPIA
jgi:ribosomal protein L40E